MKKAIKIILWIIGILIVALAVLYGIVRLNMSSDSRTSYGGSVRIEPVSLEEIKASLDKQGCNFNDYKEGALSSCIYQESDASYERSYGKKGILVYPGGFGWGPTSFYIAEDTLWDSADISGSPDVDRFKEVVRRHAHFIGDIVQIKEDT